MLQTATILLAITALGGLLMAVIRFTTKLVAAFDQA